MADEKFLSAKVYLFYSLASCYHKCGKGGIFVIRSILLGEQLISYTLSYKKVKNINLRIKADGEICVSAAKSVPLTTIEDFLRRKSQWILSVLAEVQQGKPQPSDNEVYCCGTVLTLPSGTDRSVWQKNKAAELLPASYDKAWELFQDVGFSKPVLHLRKMKSRWGSCIPSKGVITLNTALVGASVDCQIAVAAHELCHMLHPNHSKAFYAELCRRYPNYEQQHKTLNLNQAFLLYS